MSNIELDLVINRLEAGIVDISFIRKKPKADIATYQLSFARNKDTVWRMRQSVSFLALITDSLMKHQLIKLLHLMGAYISLPKERRGKEKY